MRIVEAPRLFEVGTRTAHSTTRKTRSPDSDQSAVHPMFGNLHSDPRWLRILRTLGKAPEQLAAIKFDVKVPQ